MMKLRDKSGRFAAVWIFVGMFLFIFLIALIEPMKPFLNIAIDGLSCSTATNSFILGTCFIMRGGVVLFMGTVIIFLIRWVYAKSVER